MKPSAFTIIMIKCEKNAIERQSSVSKDFFSKFISVFLLYKLHNGHTDKNEQEFFLQKGQNLDLNLTLLPQRRLVNFL